MNDTENRVASSLSYDDFLTGTKQSLELAEIIEKVANSSAEIILIEGEIGTGKGMVAKAIHDLSPNFQSPYIEIDSASMNEGSMAEALERAQGGTLFMGQIDQLSLPLQAQLAQMLDTQKLGVRIMAATSMNMKEALQNHTFREGLYYRLQLISIHLMPLRDQPEEILPLIQHLVQRLNPKYSRRMKGISPEAQVFLKAYSWPGNIRELKNMVERIMLLEDIEWIEPQHLPHEIRLGGHSAAPYRIQIPDEGVKLDEVEKELIAQALEKAMGNQTKASKLLGISRHTLRYRMEKFGIA